MTFNETRTPTVEWPTIALISLVYAALATLVWNHEIIPWWLMLPLGAYCAGLHSSLQHEVLHGHPTRHRTVNEALVFLTPSFWLPFGRYRDTHLAHHRDIDLTDPVRDPESYYQLPETWAKSGGLRRLVFTINQTLAGRMLIGPAVSIVQFWGSEFSELLAGRRDIRPAWAGFAVSCVLSSFLISAVAGMPLWKYILLVAYPGISLALVRSFCEHQAAAQVDHRTIIVEASPFWSLLFLYNNLHVAHHTKPAMPWYRLPAYYRAHRNELMTKNNGYAMRGYAEIFRHYFFKAKEPIPYPDMSWLRPSGES